MFAFRSGGKSHQVLRRPFICLYAGAVKCALNLRQVRGHHVLQNSGGNNNPGSCSLPKTHLNIRRTLGVETPPFSPKQTAIAKFVHLSFSKYLLVTNTLLSGVLMVVGDLAAQEIRYRHKPNTDKDRVDTARVYRMFKVGCLQGPLHQYAYKLMDKFLPRQNFRTSVIKILLDQLVLAPICIVLFYYTACYFEGKSMQQATGELSEKFWLIYLVEWLMWPPVQYVNFRYFPVRYRVAYVSVWMALFNIFLSFMKHEYDTW